MENTVKIKNETPGKDEVTIISTGVKIEGIVNSDGNVRIDGIIQGDVNARGNITVGDNGEIKGKVNADTVVVGGKITGTVNSKEKLVLEANAVLVGDIITKILVIAPGAKFDGSSKMSSSSGSESKLTGGSASPNYSDKKNI